MTRKWLIAAALLTAVAMLWVAGCSDDDDEETPTTYSIAVTAPSTGANWLVGETNNITWTDLNVDAFDVKLSLNNGTSWTNVATNVTANTYAWNVPNSPSTTAKIRVISHADTTVFGTSGAFTIALPTIVDYWDATTASLVPLGVDSMTYTFGLGTYEWLMWFNLLDTEIRESGTYEVDGDSIHFAATVRDGTPIAENYMRWHSFTTGNAMLNVHVWNDTDEQFETVQFTRVP
ncbi:MAG: hypothetical protein PHI18_09010 [bacterium]|nr:hypothetical protein [bacterium]